MLFYFGSDGYNYYHLNGLTPQKLISRQGVLLNPDFYLPA